MKKLLLYSATAVLLGMASCSQEEVFIAENGDGNVNFTLRLPDNQFATRAFSDGYTAINLDYAVYDGSTDNYITSGSAAFESGLSTTVSLQLANGRSYRIAFFASNESQNVYTFNGQAKSVSVDYAAMSSYNSTDYDCFYKMEEIETVTGPISKTITLTRPLAQINWGTNDLDNPFVTAADAYGTNADNLQSTVTVRNVYSTFDLISGAVTGETADVTFPVLARPAATETFPVKNADGTKAYDYVSMQYVLVDGGDNTLVEATLTPSNKSGFTGTPVVVANLPVQRNYRTNIYGALLTSPANFTVTKDPIYNTSDINHPVVVAKSVQDLTTAIANGGNVEIANNLQFAKAQTLNITKSTNLNLNGKTITGEVNENYNDEGDIIHISGGTSKLSNGSIIDAHEWDGKSSPAGTIYVDNAANVTLDNLEVEGVYPVWLKDNGSEMTIKSGNYSSTVSQCIYVQGQSKVTIEGGTFFAPMWGTKNYCLNVKDSQFLNGKKATEYIEVKGGTFIGFNPAQNAENPQSSFVADGYESVEQAEKKTIVEKEYTVWIVQKKATANP